jgi:hypothetical protein
LKAISGLSEARLQSAVSELRRHCLLDVMDAGEEPRYYIHQLTRTFLRKELLDE